MRKDAFELEFKETEKFNNGFEDGTKRELDNIPCDHGFWVNEDTYQICHSTGYEVSWAGEWWNEYIDSTGCYHYGR